MDRETALREAFEWISWQGDDFEMGSGDLWRLTTAITSSVETVAVHSLDRLHKWLWPAVSKTPLGEAFEFGPARFTVVEKLPAQDREDSKTGVQVDVGGRSWKLAWFDMEGREPHLAVGVRNDEHYLGYEPAAYCEFGERGYYKGGLNATGDDVGEMFDLFAILRPLVPSALLAVRDGTHNDWRLDGAEVVLEQDGGLAGATATELHRMAEQHASAKIFDWARLRTTDVAAFLADQRAMVGTEALRFSDGGRTAMAVECEMPGRVAFFETQFPHRGLFDRYLVWADLGDDGLAERVGFRSLDEGEGIDEAIDLLNADALSPTAIHDYQIGETFYAPGRTGFNHLSHFAASVHAISMLVRDFDPALEGELFERSPAADPSAAI